MVGGVSHLATVAAGSGVILPESVAGISVTVVNRGAEALLVYPPVSSSIDALSTNAAYSMPVNTTQEFVCASTTTWYTKVAVNSASGTVTSVGLSMPAMFTVSGSPVTTTGTLTAVLASQAANSVHAAPNGSVGPPSFRQLVAADIPTLAQSKITSLTSDLAAKAPLASPTFTGTPVLPDTTTIGAAGPVIGYRDIPITISNAAKTFALADAGKGFGKDNATAYTYTIPANASIAFPVGTAISVFNGNATSNITIAITTDTLRLGGTATTGSRTLAPWGTCTLWKIASTVWVATGAGLT